MGEGAKASPCHLPHPSNHRDTTGGQSKYRITHDTLKNLLNKD